MSEEQKESFSGIFTPELGDLEKHWVWMMTLGILFVVLGTLGIGMALVLTVASVLIFGMLLILGGGFQLIHAWRYCKGWSGILSHVANALLYLVLGAIIVNDPLVASTLLTLIIGVALIMVGILRAISALQYRATPAWSWTLLAGITSILIGFMIMGSWPASGLWAIGLFIALELIMAGWSYILFALSVKKMNRNRDDRAEA
jgi:uncharacterized membrane protein HdeD (DUF308 family)